MSASGDPERGEAHHPAEDGEPRGVRLGDPRAAAGPPRLRPRLHPLRLLHQQDPQERGPRGRGHGARGDGARLVTTLTT